VSLLSPRYFVAGPAGWFIPAGRSSGLLVSGIPPEPGSLAGPADQHSRTAVGSVNRPLFDVGDDQYG